MTASGSRERAFSPTIRLCAGTPCRCVPLAPPRAPPYLCQETPPGGKQREARRHAARFEAGE
jgi:hypothetical protein